MWERKHWKEREETVRLEKERQTRRDRERRKRREAHRQEEERRRKRTERQTVEEMTRAWQTYSASWDTLNSNPPTVSTLHFQNISWPIQNPLTSPELLTAARSLPSCCHPYTLTGIGNSVFAKRLFFIGIGLTSGLDLFAMKPTANLFVKRPGLWSVSGMLCSKRRNRSRGLRLCISPASGK